VSTPRRRAHSTATSVREYARGAAGGLLFSLPLLYTMEMWWAGFLASPRRLLGAIAGTFVLLLGYNRYAGMHHDTSWTEIAIDSVEELGVGLIGAACILWLLGRIEPGMPMSEILGRVVVQGLAGAIGVSIGTAQLGGDDGFRDRPPAKADAARRPQSIWSHLALAACGAVVVAGNVAPTDEIAILGAELSGWQLAGLSAASLVMAAVVLHFSEFRGSVPHGESGWLGVVQSAVTTYAVAVVTSLVLLWFFGRFAGAAAGIVASETIVLSFAASLGASAGRLLLQS
jgi:putative integral membrane protein (TIGR02587 family)